MLLSVASPYGSPRSNATSQLPTCGMLKLTYKAGKPIYTKLSLVVGTPFDDKLPQQRTSAAGRHAPGPDLILTDCRVKTGIEAGGTGISSSVEAITTSDVSRATASSAAHEIAANGHCVGAGFESFLFLLESLGSAARVSYSRCWLHDVMFSEVDRRESADGVYSLCRGLTSRCTRVSKRCLLVDSMFRNQPRLFLSSDENYCGRWKAPLSPISSRLILEGTWVSRSDHHSTKTPRNVRQNYRQCSQNLSPVLPTWYHF